MRDVLGRAGRAALAAIAADEPLFVFDFDGTLAPIVDRPDAARMRPETRRLLGRLARAAPCAVLSGRAAADVAARVARLPLLAIVGNHGAEERARRGSRAERGLVAAWRPELERRLAGMPGVEIEDKGLSLSVHTRRARRPAIAEAFARRAAAGLPGARIVDGKRVVNVVPAAAPHKGDALASLARRAGRRTVLYVGDDVTDEDAFAAASGRGLAVRVGASRRSCAAWFVRSQVVVDDLLAELLSGAPRRELG